MKPRKNLSLYDLTKEEDEDGIEYLISGVLPKKGLAVLIGSYGTGKTQLAMRMGACIASGEPFSFGKLPAYSEAPFDFCMPRGRGYTLYIAGEGKHNIRARIKATKLSLSDGALKELDNHFQGLFPIIPAKINLPFKEGNHIDEIEDLIFLTRLVHHDLPTKPSLIIFDTLAASHEFKDDNHNSEMQRVVNHLQSCSDYFDCCVLVITHPPKSNDGPKGYNRGASTLVNSADVVIEIKKVNASRQRDVHIRKMKDGPYETASFQFKIENFGSAPAFIPVNPATNKDTKSQTSEAIGLSDTQNMILEVLEEETERSMLQKDLVNHLLSKSKDITNIETKKRLIRRQIKNLIDRGTIEKDGSGKTIFLRLAKDIISNGEDGYELPSSQESVDEENDAYEDNEEIDNDIY